jgi:hypothetical protein
LTITEKLKDVPILPVRELDFSMAALCRRLQLSAAAVSLSVQRGEKIARENNYSLIDDN